MSKNEIQSIKINYIHTPVKIKTPVKIDVILEQRMKEFMLSRRQRRWIELGQ